MKLLFSVSLVLVIWAWAMNTEYQEAKARSFDERKWERIQANREKRRAIEARYESCLQSCRKVCK